MIINLCIVTYANGEAITMYDEYLVGLAGAGAKYRIFINSNSELCSTDENHPNTKLTRYDTNGDSAYAVVLAKSVAAGTDGSVPTKYYIGDIETTEEEYQAYYESSYSGATYLITQADAGVGGNAMTYDSACDYLRSNS